MEEETQTPGSKKVRILIPLITFLALALAGGTFWLGRKTTAPKPQQSPTPFESPSPSPEESPLVIGSPTPKPAKTGTPTPIATATPTPTTTATATPTPEPKADLYISEYSFDHPPKKGEAFTVRIGIYNKGDKAAGGFWWEWWATTSAPSYACRQRIDSLAAHGGRIVYCTYTYGGWANYTTKAIADTDNEVSESDEGNNTYSQNVVPIH